MRGLGLSSLSRHFLFRPRRLLVGLGEHGSGAPQILPDRVCNDQVVEQRLELGIFGAGLEIFRGGAGSAYCSLSRDAAPRQPLPTRRPLLRPHAPPCAKMRAPCAILLAPIPGLILGVDDSRRGDHDPGAAMPFDRFDASRAGQDAAGRRPRAGPALPRPAPFRRGRRAEPNCRAGAASPRGGPVFPWPVSP